MVANLINNLDLFLNKFDIIGTYGTVTILFIDKRKRPYKILSFI
jgi:hypothetical protein